MEKRGFSLIELSVVLVIIGLLVGVLVAARSLRSTAQVQAVITDFGKYKTAAIQYKEKYYYWPGDDPNATNVWQEIPANGNGDGQIYGGGTFYAYSGGYNGISLPGEITLAFQELAMSGFIAGTYNAASTGFYYTRHKLTKGRD